MVEIGLLSRTSAMTALCITIIVANALLPVNAQINHSCMKAGKTRTGKECHGKLYKIDSEISRVTQLPENSFLCRFHWDTARRDNLRCSCPQQKDFKHSKLNGNRIPRRYYVLFDRIGSEMPHYRPGTRWCNRCKNTASERFDDQHEKDARITQTELQAKVKTS